MSVKVQENIAKALLWIAALITLVALVAIIGYVFSKGLSHVDLEFLLERPRKMGAKGGIFPTIVGTIYFTIVAIAIAAPIGVGAAVFLNEYTKQSALTSVIRAGTDALAGIPSIIFGLFGFAFFVVLLEPITNGWSILSGALTGACMILPTIIRTAEEALKTVPLSFREGSLALGATKWQTISKVVLPSAIPGIITGIILGIGRVVGETAALILTLGGSLQIPVSIFDGTRTMSMHMYSLSMEVGAFDKAFATATVLIITILLINLTANWIMSRFVAKLS